MITAITLQNFKGIGEAVRIPLRPITLMFGANSSGKSTIIQAIHYAREILERNNVNPDKTLTGGASIDLGGFRSLVHNHNTEIPITLRFDLDLTDVDLPDYTMWARYMSPTDYANEEAPDLSSEVQSADVALTVMWSGIEQRPIVRSYQVGINGEPMVRTTASFDEKQFTLEVNLKNKLFIKWFGQEGDSDASSEDPSEPTNWSELKTSELTNAVPSSWDRPLYIRDSPFMADENFSLYLAQMMLGPGQILSSLLATFRYLGPIRSIPERNHQPALTPDESRWADGTAAWDALYRPDDDTLLIELHHWMSDERLKTGYGIFLDKFRAIPSHSELYAALTSNTLLDDIENIAEEFKKFPVRMRFRITTEDGRLLEVQPSDIGVGISQVVPVIVLALDTRDGIVAIEQPELHLHPAMQAELGDLFIESALGKGGNQFLIETHSEHIILRILRRIRETTANKNGSIPAIIPENLSLLFVSSDSNGTNVLALRVDERGRIIDPIPGGFFEEDFAELF
jgi:hypothetical protein